MRVKIKLLLEEAPQNSLLFYFFYFRIRVRIRVRVRVRAVFMGYRLGMMVRVMD
jgi:hypothetical protein